MTQLKPVSDAMRRALALLGETPDEHQKEKLTRSRAPTRIRIPTKGPFVPPTLESTATVAARLIAKTPEPVWLADARVLFLRKRTCRCCGVAVDEMHYPETFIRMRSKADPRTIKYIPARSSLFANLELPRLTVNTPVKTYYCPSCWTDDEHPLENPVCLSELVSLPTATTESSSDSTAPTNGSAGLSPSTPSPLNPSDDPASDLSLPLPSGTGALSLALAHLLGSTFASFADAPSASARLTPILTA
jgi:hypothetical protein